MSELISAAAQTAAVAQTTAAARPPVVLRPLQEGDAPALLAFYNGLSRASIRTFRPLGEATTLEVCERIVAENDPARRLRYDFVACDEDAIIGWGFLARLDGEAPSFGLGIADAHQGRGLGKALIDRVLAWAQANRIARVRLVVVKDNARAVCLYESRGFVTHGEFIDDKDKLPYLRQVAELPAAALADGAV